MQYRQGDVLIESVDSIPTAAVAEKGRVILAHGEATGHAHEIKSRRYAKLLTTTADERFLRLAKTAMLEHQEHAPIRLPAGQYHIVLQREYSPEEIRNVAD